MTMNESMITLAAFDSGFSAHLLSARLTSDGVRNIIQTDEFYGKMTSGTHMVVVNEGDLVAASATLSEFQSVQAAPDSQRLQTPRNRLITWLLLGVVVGIPVVVNLIIWLR